MERPLKKTKLSSSNTMACASTSARGAGAKKRRTRTTEKRMNELFQLLGVNDVDRVSQCLRAAILKGFVKLEDPKNDSEGKFGLDQPLISGKCIACDKKLTCRVRDVLYQPDYAGTDYEDGGEDATFRCNSTDYCSVGIYVTRICTGTPTFDSGKFHNHCDLHPNHGYCIGDYRDRHCERCGKHYYAGGDCVCDCYQEEDDESSDEETEPF